MTRRMLLRALGLGGVAVGFGGVTAVVDLERALWVPHRKTIFLPPTTTFVEDREVGIRMRFVQAFDLVASTPPQRFDLFNPTADLATQYREGVLSRKSGLLYDEWDAPPYGYSPEAKAAWDAEIKRCARQMADRIDAELVAQIYCVHGLDATEASKHRMGVIADVRA